MKKKKNKNYIFYTRELVPKPFSSWSLCFQAAMRSAFWPCALPSWLNSLATAQIAIH